MISNRLRAVAAAAATAISAGADEAEVQSAMESGIREELKFANTTADAQRFVAEMAERIKRSAA